MGFVWALAGPLKDSQRIVPKPLQRCLGCMLVIVTLKGELSPQSEVAYTLEQVFFKHLSVFRCIHHSCNSGQSPCPCHRVAIP